MNRYLGFSQKLKEILVNEVSLKQLKMQFPDYSEWLDKAASEVENKYLVFMVKKLKHFDKDLSSSPQEMREIFPDLTEISKRFEVVSKNGKLDAVIKTGKGLPEQKDINFWIDKPLYELYDFVVKAEDTVTDSEKRKLAKAASSKIYEDERFTVIIPESYEASCYFGAGTKWCISGKTSTHYKSYVSQGYEFVFIIDKTPNDPRYQKVAVAFVPKKVRNWDIVEIFDATDDPIPLEDYEKGPIWPVVEKYIRKRWAEAEQELQEKIPFKVGDRVKYSKEGIETYSVMYKNYHMPEFEGELAKGRGTVIDIDSVEEFNNGSYELVVEWDNGKKYNFDEKTIRYLEKAE
jgi:hypothetical protein